MICAQSGSLPTSEHQPGIVQPSHTFNPFGPSTAPAGTAHRGLSHLQSVRPECRADRRGVSRDLAVRRSEEHTSELQSLMRISYAVFCLKKKQYKEQT